MKDIKSTHYRFLLFSLGILSLASQVIILREFIFVFYGNELIIGVFLMLWMMFSGLGAYLKRWILRKTNITVISIIHIFYCLIPLLSVWGLVELRNFFFPDGVLLSFSKIIIICIIVLIPVGTISGFLFVAYSELLSKLKKKNKIASAYVYDSLGSIAGGIIASFVFAYIGMTFQQLILIAVISLLIIVFVLMKNKKKLLHALGFLTLTGLIILLVSENIDQKYMSQIYNGQRIQEIKLTPYGKLVVTEINKQKNIYENNQLLHTDFDIVNNEEAVHFCMLQRKNPENVLVLSGGLFGQLDEIQKYDSVNIDYVDINPAILEWINKDTLNRNNNVKLIHSDARRYVSHTKKKYDVVLINIQEPSTAQMNRFYTLEFYKDIKKILTDNAVVSFPLTTENNYISDENAELLEMTYNTLKSVFNYVEIIPGQKNYFLASDEKLNTNITDLYRYSYIENTYVNNLYLDSLSMKMKQAGIYNSFTGNKLINKDYMPYSYLKQIKYWMKSIFNIELNPYYLLILFGIVFFILFFIYHPASSAVMTTSLTGSYVELMIIMLYQVLFGYAYYITGIIFTLFMTGFATGAWLGQRYDKRNIFWLFIKTQILILIFTGLIFAGLIIIKHIQIEFLIHIILLLFVFIASLLVAVQFAIASQINQKKISIVASNVYTADMLGGAIGAVAVSVILIPLFGFIYTSLLIIGLNVVAIIKSILFRKTFSSRFDN